MIRNVPALLGSSLSVMYNLLSAEGMVPTFTSRTVVHIRND